MSIIPRLSRPPEEGKESVRVSLSVIIKRCASLDEVADQSNSR